MKFECAPDLSVSSKEVRASELFDGWYQRQEIPLGRVRVNAAFSWGGQIRMLQLSVWQEDGHHPVATFLRGASVDILTVLHTPGFSGQPHVVMVEQPRIPVGRNVISNPAGMIDSGESPAAALLRELAEETGIDIEWGAPIPLNLYLCHTNEPMLTSPGGTDEEVIFYAVIGQIELDDLLRLNDKAAGLAEEGESTRLRIIPFKDVLPRLAQAGRPDMKTVLSYHGYRLHLREIRKLAKQN